MIWTALVVAFLVYPTVLALKDAMVRPHPVPAAPISESTKELASTRGGMNRVPLTPEEKNSPVRLRTKKHNHTPDEGETHGAHGESRSVVVSVREVHDDQFARSVDHSEWHLKQQ